MVYKGKDLEFLCEWSDMIWKERKSLIRRRDWWRVTLEKYLFVYNQNNFWKSRPQVFSHIFANPLSSFSWTIFHLVECELPKLALNIPNDFSHSKFESSRKNAPQPSNSTPLFSSSKKSILIAFPTIGSSSHSFLISYLSVTIDFSFSISSIKWYTPPFHIVCTSSISTVFNVLDCIILIRLS